MAYRITSTNVRNRLKNLTSVDITDDQLHDIAYIPSAQATVDVILSDNGVTYASLSNAKKILVKAAQIALAAMTVLMEAPVETFKTGPIESKNPSASDIERFIKILEKEYKDKLALVGAAYIVPEVNSQTSDDYKPDGEDDTNLILGDEKEDTYSIYQ